MDDKLAALLLEKVMQTPDVVDDLWQAKHGTPEDRHSTAACLRLDKLLGGTGKPDSKFAIELSYNAGTYLDFIMSPNLYPDNLRKKANNHFPPLGHKPTWQMPEGFHQDKGLLAWIAKLINKQVDTKLRRGGMSVTLIIVQKPSQTRLLYPWQQAISANHALTVWHPATMQPMFPRISSSYLAVGQTKAYQVCYHKGQMQCAKVPILIERGLEQVFEYQTLSLAEEKEVFDSFISGLR